jgi:hypothetical protein
MDREVVDCDSSNDMGSSWRGRASWSAPFIAATGRDYDCLGPVRRQVRGAGAAAADDGREADRADVLRAVVLSVIDGVVALCPNPATGIR